MTRKFYGRKRFEIIQHRSIDTYWSDIDGVTLNLSISSKKGQVAGYNYAQ